MGESLEERIYLKLWDMHEAGAFRIFNGAMGDIVEYNVYVRCKREGVEDDASIRRFILEDPNIKPHLPDAAQEQ